MWLSPESTCKAKPLYLVGAEKCNTSRVPKKLALRPLISFKAEIIGGLKLQMSSVSQLTIENGKPSHLGPAGPIFSRSQDGPNSKANGRPVGSQELVLHDTRPQFVLKGSEMKLGFCIVSDSLFSPLFSKPLFCYLGGGSIFWANFGTCHCWGSFSDENKGRKEEWRNPN